MSTKEVKVSKAKKGMTLPLMPKSPDHLMSRAEAAEYGRSLRSKAQRASHAAWKAPSDRLDPVDILIETSKGREAQLVPIRYGRMLQSPFAFYRGAAAIMAADLAKTPSTGALGMGCKTVSSQLCDCCNA
jgi:Uncharacterized protein conserved in bacteria (DUF2252)